MRIKRAQPPSSLPKILRNLFLVLLVPLPLSSTSRMSFRPVGLIISPTHLNIFYRPLIDLNYLGVPYNLVAASYYPSLLYCFITLYFNPNHLLICPCVLPPQGFYTTVAFFLKWLFSPHPQLSFSCSCFSSQLKVHFIHISVTYCVPGNLLSEEKKFVLSWADILVGGGTK